MKKVLLLIILATLMLTLYGCANSEIRAEDIKFIEIREGSLKSSYAVDEEIDFKFVFIVITLRDNKGEIVEKVTPSMIEGFDVSTTTLPTEPRSMRIKYKGIYTTDWNYIVTNENAISTKARLTLSKNEIDEYLHITVAIKLEEIEQIKALLMEITFDTSRLSLVGEIETKNNGWAAQKKSISPGGFKLLYAFEPGASPITQDAELFTMIFKIEEKGTAKVELKNIILSYGTRDVNLPSVKLI